MRNVLVSRRLLQPRWSKRLKILALQKNGYVELGFVEKLPMVALVLASLPLYLRHHRDLLHLDQNSHVRSQIRHSDQSLEKILMLETCSPWRKITIILPWNYVVKARKTWCWLQEIFGSWLGEDLWWSKYNRLEPWLLDWYSRWHVVGSSLLRVQDVCQKLSICGYNRWVYAMPLFRKNWYQRREGEGYQRYHSQATAQLTRVASPSFDIRWGSYNQQYLSDKIQKGSFHWGSLHKTHLQQILRTNH